MMAVMRGGVTRVWGAGLAAAVLGVACLALTGASDGVAAPHAKRAVVPHIKHVFVIVLENENGETTFGADPPAPYLAQTLKRAGAYVPNYYGIGHASLDNYIAMASGQPPNLVTQSDCRTYSDFTPGTLRSDGIALGQGCVYPSPVKTVANQLEAKGDSWHGYMEDMANSVAAGASATCRHPAIGAVDDTQAARANDQYATRHDPFVYFHAITDHPTCRRNVVDLKHLTADLKREAKTPAYSFITPDLCADGHDATCADPYAPGGYEGIQAFLKQWVPKIKRSAAYRDQGMILLTFDESAAGADSCCGKTSGPNTPNNGNGAIGDGGGRVGAVMLSPCIRPGTVSRRSYNHYSMLRWVEDDFRLSHLASAAKPGVRAFGSDILNRPDCVRHRKHRAG